MDRSSMTRISSLTLAMHIAGCAGLEPDSGSMEGVWIPDSGASEGPTVLVFAGGRKDQEMPRLAVRQVAGWEPIAGRLVAVSIGAEVLPRGFHALVAELAPAWTLDEGRTDSHLARHQEKSCERTTRYGSSSSAKEASGPCGRTG